MMAEIQKAAESATTKNKMAVGDVSETAAKKERVAISNATIQKVRHPSATPAERHRLIAETAFLKAERRGFDGGDPVEDWLEAEKEVDSSLTD